MMPKYSWKPLVRPNVKGSSGNLPATRGWASLHSRLLEWRRAKAAGKGSLLLGLAVHFAGLAVTFLQWAMDAQSLPEGLELGIWAYRLRNLYLVHDAVIDGLILDADRHMHLEDRRILAKHRAQVRSWAAAATAGSCKAGHAYLRKANVELAQPYGMDQLGHVMTLDPAAALVRRVNFWSGWWCRDFHMMERLRQQIIELRCKAKWSQHRLPPIELQEVHDAVGRLRNGRGLGCDHWAPLEWKALPDQAIAGLHELLLAIEASCSWPMQALINVMCLLPKPMGGDRAIVLQPLLVVLWASIRCRFARRWDEQWGMFWDSALRGSSALRDSLARRLCDEVAVAEGSTNIDVYWDVEKLYDSISLLLLLEEADRYKFPIGVTALDIQVHAGVRTLRWCGGCSDPLVPSSSILAGSKFSNCYARVYLYEVMQSMHDQVPIQMGQHVDDIAQAARGALHLVKRHTVQAAVLLKGMLGKRHLAISGKSVAVCSRPGVLKGLLKELEDAGVPCGGALSAKDLGLDTGAGVRRSVKVFRGRVLKGSKRVAKLRVINKLGAKGTKLYRTNVWPTSTWGVASMGCPPTTLKTLRRQAAQSVLTTGGRCTTTTIDLGYPDGADPAAAIREEIIMQWVKLWLDADAQLQQRIRAVWPRQLSKLLRKDRWRVVAGSMWAVIATLFGLEWCPDALM